MLHPCTRQCKLLNVLGVSTSRDERAQISVHAKAVVLAAMHIDTAQVAHAAHDADSKLLGLVLDARERYLTPRNQACSLLHPARPVLQAVCLLAT